MNDNLHGLEKFQKEKRENTIQKVKEAIKSLQEESLEINFKSVSRKSSITRKTLYKVSEIRELIESLRPAVPNSDNQEKLSLMISELKAENSRLKDELATLNRLQADVTELKRFISEKGSLQ